MNWFTYAIAFIGHGFLWVAIVNRVHAFPIPRPVLKSFTRVCVSFFVAIPVMIALAPLTMDFIVPEGGSQSLVFALDVLAKNYVWLCCLVAVCSLLAKCYEARHRYDSHVVLESTTEELDFTKDLTESPFHGKFSARIEKIPGNQTTKLAIEKRSLLLPNFPPDLSGLKLIHLSDLHMTGRLDRSYFERLTEEVNRQQPDVIALTGDIVEKTECWPWLESTLGEMNARLGRYFIIGNHDLFIDHGESIRKLEQLGWTYLGDDWHATVWDGVNVALGGNEMHWKGPPAEPPGKQQGEFRLVLTHSPDQFPWCREAKADLALAGHTHGGQFCVPVLGPIVSPSVHGTRYCCGVFRFGETVLHVSRGVSGKMPLRLNCPPELAVLTLTVDD
ncbi:metallophosphoesterase [Adhaeretor mobilis]|uniref:Putative metallophosphoesterase n=1 Tax=Adhaeretor mobilis TaxID=1930276 RepID=A0A517MU99_9BACT|nr:metallophosphoesterase [Adhaeretor mobilis]QDS98367.1 putative metallophosphoesterase [Adhaeretor mobilis]